MTNEYGVRYLELHAFIRYCEELNLRTDESELEYYEKTGVMPPLVRVNYPDDYIKTSSEYSLGLGKAPPLKNWPDLERLEEKIKVFPKDYANLTDDELIHSFDREIGCNGCLKVPTMGSFRPWNSYGIIVPGPHGEKFRRSNTENYYGYWQVHQIWQIQQNPDLYRNCKLLDEVSDAAKVRLFGRWPLDLTPFGEFGGKAKLFDMLSFWITISSRERSRTFALVPVKNQAKYLDAAQTAAYRASLIADAQLVQKRYGMTIGSLYEFLHQLIDLQNKYKKVARNKLSEEVQLDILHLVRLIELISQVDWDQIAVQLVKKYPSDQNGFRHLNIMAKEYDEAHDVLRIEATRYGDALKKVGITQAPTFVFSEAEVDNVLNYYEKEGLSLMITALSGMVAGAENYDEKFRHVILYSNLKNTATALEYLMKNILIKQYPQMDGATLTPVVQKFMNNEKWFKLFEQKLNLIKAKGTAGFFANLNNLLQDKELIQSENNYWARVFLISCLTRNLTVHFYPEDDWFYAESFGVMLSALVQALLYVWLVAKRGKWV